MLFFMTIRAEQFEVLVATVAWVLVVVVYLKYLWNRAISTTFTAANTRCDDALTLLSPVCIFTFTSEYSCTLSTTKAIFAAMVYGFWLSAVCACKFRIWFTAAKTPMPQEESRAWISGFQGLPTTTTAIPNSPIRLSGMRRKVIVFDGTPCRQQKATATGTRLRSGGCLPSSDPLVRCQFPRFMEACGGAVGVCSDDSVLETGPTTSTDAATAWNNLCLTKTADGAEAIRSATTMMKLFAAVSARVHRMVRGSFSASHPVSPTWQAVLLSVFEHGHGLLCEPFRRPSLALSVS